MAGRLTRVFNPINICGQLYGLRSLAPSDPQYRGRYTGDGASRDGAYHQGTVWPWLMGPFDRLTIEGDFHPSKVDANAVKYVVKSRTPDFRVCRIAVRTRASSSFGLNGFVT